MATHDPKQATWYAIVKDKVLGPMSADDLRRMARQQQLAPSDMVRRGADGKWAAAQNVKGLFDDPAAQSTLAVPTVASTAPQKLPIVLSAQPVAGPTPDTSGIPIMAPTQPSAPTPPQFSSIPSTAPLKVEQVYLRQNVDGKEAVVTSTRFVVGTNTYAMAHISSVHTNVEHSLRPQKTAANVLISLACCFPLGLWLLFAAKSKPKYHVIVATTGGQITAVTTLDRQAAESISHALTTALVDRG